MTYAANREEAAGKVRGALELYRQEGRSIPRPSRRKADFLVDVKVEEAHVAAPAPAGRFRRIASRLPRRALAQS